MDWMVGAVLALVVVVSGCSSFMDSMSPMQRFQDLSDKRESSTYRDLGVELTRDTPAPTPSG